MAGYNNVVGTAKLLYPRIPTTAFASINQTNSEENIIIFQMLTDAKKQSYTFALLLGCLSAPIANYCIIKDEKRYIVKVSDTTMMSNAVY